MAEDTQPHKDHKWSSNEQTNYNNDINTIWNSRKLITGNDLQFTSQQFWDFMFKWLAA